MTGFSSTPKLDANEQHFRISGPRDGLPRDDDARSLFDAFAGSPIKRDIKIGRGTHLMHLEAMRLALWQESIAFLLGGDVASVP